MHSIEVPTKTVIALASGKGRSGVAVIRLSGPDALAVCDQLTQGGAPLPHRAAVRDIVSPRKGEFLDRALVLVMPGPRSFTGEDVVEFQVHGGSAVIESVLNAAFETGLCRAAGPGEFTRRAFENGKLDLAQAEAVADLIDAETDLQRRLAARVYHGEASQVFDSWRESLLSAMSALEAVIDFPDEADIPQSLFDETYSRVEQLSGQFNRALASAEAARAIRDGVRVAILGAPNAGKSSLLNRLAAREAAIVSSTPGTTRDVIEIDLIVEGFHLALSDTAGLRITDDLIEREGVRRAVRAAAAADLRIWVEDVSDPVSTGARVVDGADVQAGDVFVLNKIDVFPHGDVDACVPSNPSWVRKSNPIVRLSAQTGEGVDQLRELLAEFIRGHFASDEPLLVTRRRHLDLIAAAQSDVQRALSGLRDGLGPELVFEDLRMAARHIGAITGVLSSEQILDRIFADFCIGK